MGCFINDENQKAMKVIMTCFSGEDGGVSFVKFKLGMETIEQEDSYASTAIMEIMQRFAKLILTLQKKEEDLDHDLLK